MPIPALVRRCAIACGALLPLAGCSSLQSSDSFLGLITPYRVEIVQGNVVTREQIQAVKPGMTRVQVREVLGSPLLTDPFHGDRWDYFFLIRRQGTEPQRRNIVLRFEGDTLKSVDAPDLPTEQEFVAAISTVRRSGRVPVLELSEEQRKALPAPVRAEPPPAEPTGPARSYPPLEPQ